MMCPLQKDFCDASIALRTNDIVLGQRQREIPERWPHDLRRRRLLDTVKYGQYIECVHSWIELKNCGIFAVLSFLNMPQTADQLQTVTATHCNRRWKTILHCIAIMECERWWLTCRGLGLGMVILISHLIDKENVVGEFLTWNIFSFSTTQRPTDKHRMFNSSHIQVHHLHHIVSCRPSPAN